MGTTGHGGGGLRRARRLVPAAAVVAAAAAGIAGALVARGARRTATPDPDRSMAGPASDRPSLPARRAPVPPPRRRRLIGTPAPPEPDIDLDIASRALTALTTAEPAPAPSGAAEAGDGGGDPHDRLDPVDPVDRPNGSNGHAPLPPRPRRPAEPVEAGEQAEGDDAGEQAEPVEAGEQAEGDDAAEAVQPVVRPEPVAGVVRPEPAPPPLPTPPVAPSPVAPSAVPPPPVAPRPVAEVRRHRARLVAGVVVVLLGIGVGAALTGGSDEDDTAAPETTTTTEQVTTATTPPPVSAATVFARAADELVDAGSFAYSGTVSATDISHVRPMLWLGVESTVNGEVSLDLGQVHELAVTDGERASETITAGPAVWGRRTSELATLGEAVYEPVPELSEAEGTPTVRGAALLPTWLAATTAPSDLGRDPAGRRTFVGTVPAAALGPVERGADAADGQLTLSLGPDGSPAHIELVTLSGPSFRLTIDLTNLGRTVVIQPPAPPAA